MTIPEQVQLWALGPDDIYVGAVRPTFDWKPLGDNRTVRTRITNTLLREGYDTLSKVLAATWPDLLDIQGFGTGMAVALDKFLQQDNLGLKWDKLDSSFWHPSENVRWTTVGLRLR